MIKIILIKFWIKTRGVFDKFNGCQRREEYFFSYKKYVFQDRNRTIRNIDTIKQTLTFYVGKPGPLYFLIRWTSQRHFFRTIHIHARPQAPGPVL